MADESEPTHGSFYLGTVRPPTPSLTYSATMARGTGFVGSQTEEVFSAPLTLSPIRVPLAIGTVATVSGGAIELRVKVALLGAAIAVTGYSQRYQGLPRCRFLLRGFGGRDLKEGAWFPAPITEGPLGLVGGISKKKKNHPPNTQKKSSSLTSQGTCGSLMGHQHAVGHVPSTQIC